MSGFGINPTHTSKTNVSLFPVVIPFQFGSGGDTKNRMRRFSVEKQTVTTRASHGLVIDIQKNEKTCEIWEMRIHRCDEKTSK